jgi:hypothetical protein
MLNTPGFHLTSVVKAVPDTLDMHANFSRRAAGNRVAPFTKSYTAPTPLRSSTRVPLQRLQVLPMLLVTALYI